MNVDAEYCLLGCILLDNKIIKEITVTNEQFSDYQNKDIFNAIEELHREALDINRVSLRQQLGDYKYNFFGGDGFINDLMKSVPSVHGFKTYESIIIGTWKERAVKQILKDKQEKELISKGIQDIIHELNGIDQVGMKEVFNLRNHLTALFEMPHLEKKKGMSGIPSGFKDLDLLTDGWQKEDSIILGARPSMGKTALMLEIAKNAGLKGSIPIIFSLEMSAEMLLKRSLASIGHIDLFKTRNPSNYFNDADKERWGEAITILEKINPQIYDKPRQTMNEIRAKVRQVVKDNEGKEVIVLIDYLTKIKPSQEHNGNTHAQVTEISDDLKTLAKEFHCPVITLAQLSRGVEQRSNKRPTMGDLRESGSIEQDADIVAFLYRDEYYDSQSESKGVLEIDIAKARNGPTGTVYLDFDMEKGQIRDRRN